MNVKRSFFLSLLLPLIALPLQAATPLLWADFEDTEAFPRLRVSQAVVTPGVLPLNGNALMPGKVLRAPILPTRLNETFELRPNSPIGDVTMRATMMVTALPEAGNYLSLALNQLQRGFAFTLRSDGTLTMDGRAIIGVEIEPLKPFELQLSIDLRSAEYQIWFNRERVKTGFVVLREAAPFLRVTLSSRLPMPGLVWLDNLVVLQEASYVPLIHEDFMHLDDGPLPGHTLLPGYPVGDRTGFVGAETFAGGDDIVETIGGGVPSDKRLLIKNGDGAAAGDSASFRFATKRHQEEQTLYRSGCKLKREARTGLIGIRTWGPLTSVATLIIYGNDMETYGHEVSEGIPISLVDNEYVHLQMRLDYPRETAQVRIDQTKIGAAFAVESGQYPSAVDFVSHKTADSAGYEIDDVYLDRRSVSGLVGVSGRFPRTAFRARTGFSEVDHSAPMSATAAYVDSVVSPNGRVYALNSLLKQVEILVPGRLQVEGVISDESITSGNPVSISIEGDSFCVLVRHDAGVFDRVYFPVFGAPSFRVEAGEMDVSSLRRMRSQGAGARRIYALSSPLRFIVQEADGNHDLALPADMDLDSSFRDMELSGNTLHLLFSNPGRVLSIDLASGDVVADRMIDELGIPNQLCRTPQGFFILGAEDPDTAQARLHLLDPNFVHLNMIQNPDPDLKRVAILEWIETEAILAMDLSAENNNIHFDLQLEPDRSYDIVAMRQEFLSEGTVFSTTLNNSPFFADESFKRQTVTLGLRSVEFPVLVEAYPAE